MFMRGIVQTPGQCLKKQELRRRESEFSTLCTAKTYFTFPDLCILIFPMSPSDRSLRDGRFCGSCIYRAKEDIKADPLYMDG